MNAETSDERKTPLVAAVENGHDQVATLLIRHGSDLSFLRDFQGRYENTIMHIAAEEGHVKAVDLLVKACNGLLYKTNELGETPLHVAASNNKPGTTGLLCEAQSDVHAITKIAKETPLHLAASRDNATAVCCKLIQTEARSWSYEDANGKRIKPPGKLLEKYVEDVDRDIWVDPDGDVWRKNSDGKTPLEIATPGARAVLICAGKPYTDQNTDGSGPEIHEQCEELRKCIGLVGKDAPDELPRTVKACIDVLHCGFWTKRLTSVKRTYEMAIALSDEAWKQHESVVRSHEEVSEQLQKYADLAQRVCRGLLKSLPSDDVHKMMESKDGKRALWKASALRCAYVIGWSEVQEYVEEKFWGGKDGILTIFRMPQQEENWTGLVYRYIVGSFAVVIFVVPANLVLLPVVALVPTLEDWVAKKFKYESHSLYLLDDAVVGLALAAAADAILTYLIATQLGVTDYDENHKLDFNMFMLFAVWLLAAFITEMKQIRKAQRNGQTSAHWRDPLNKLRMAGILFPVPELVAGYFGLDLVAHKHISEACLAFSIVCWVLTLVLRMLLPLPKMGPLVLVSFQMLTDVKNWTVLVVFIIVAFAIALNHTIGKERDAILDSNTTCGEIMEPFTRGIAGGALELLHIILDTGTTDMQCFEQSKFWLSGSLLMYGFQLVVVILYLNMLIGMMGITLDKVDDEVTTRQYLFTNLVIRYQKGIPAPISILSVPYDVLDMFFHKKKDDKPSEDERDKDESEDDEDAREKKKDAREKKYLAFLDLKEFKKSVDQAADNIKNKYSKNDGGLGEVNESSMQHPLAAEQGNAALLRTSTRELSTRIFPS